MGKAAGWPSRCRGVFRLLASLRCAVAILAVLAAVLVWGTMVETRDGAKAAHAAVYGTWWFVALHVLLAVNIAAAMLVRFPWRRRQTGFVLAHGGVLVLLAGCLATFWFGVQATLQVCEGRAARTADVDGRPLELGFQVFLHDFRRKLDPGATVASHYSSRVDFLDLASPSKKLREDVVITLNAPVDFTDPKSGRTYRLFQSSFEGPWRPGDREFDELAGGDRGRDEIYLSQLTVNYDPGRGVKYAGCLMIVVGIGLVYYSRRFGRRVAAAVGFAIVFAVSPCRADDRTDLDWSAWRRLPVFVVGRVAPLDTFARETVEAICGRAAPTLRWGDGRERRFDAAELLFDWLVEPSRWERVRFLIADDAQLRREILGLPLTDANGRPLRYVSPLEVETSAGLGRRLMELQQRETVEGAAFRLTGVDRNVKRLLDAYDRYRRLTYQPKTSSDAPQRFAARTRSASVAWGKLARFLLAHRRLAADKPLNERMVASGAALQQVMAEIHKDEFSLAKIEPPVAAFHRAVNHIAEQLRRADDPLLAALAADLDRKTAEMRRALYDDGDGPRLVPALSVEALEPSRTPDDDASPWLAWQTLFDGSDDLLRAYPQKELQAFRKAFIAVKAAYLNRRAADRPARFAAAMDRFAAATRTLAERIEPLRAKLPLRRRDPSLLAATAYPPPGSTDLEVAYNRLDPFFWSWTIAAAATLCLLAAVGRRQRPMFWLGIALLSAAQGFTIVGLAARGWIMGLVPLTGMFETVVFVSLYAALVGLWWTLRPLWHWRRPLDLRRKEVLDRRLFVVAGALVSVVAAGLAYFAPASVMHRNIGAVLPILRDNFWLAVHVVTIMASYASAAIALVLGNIALGCYLFGRDSERSAVMRSRLAGFVYEAMKITVLMLTAGTVLGAFWGDKAWGRFWAWDPKEVWALVSLLVYLLILHARHVGWSVHVAALLLAAGFVLAAVWAQKLWGPSWLRDPRIIAAIGLLAASAMIAAARRVGRSNEFGLCATAVLGAVAVLFTWYGVNFVLGRGMHAYGAGAGGEEVVLGAVLSQLLFVLAAAVRYLAQDRPAR